MKITLPEYITGEYAVGTECFTVVDNTRKEVLGPGEGMRRMAVRMYYPTSKEAVKGMERADIFSDRKLQALKKRFHVKDINEDMRKADYYEGVAHVDNMKFPLIIYNHGFGLYVEANTFLCCELASNGYIVASIGHAYEAVENDYEDGTYDLYDSKNNMRMYDNPVTAIISQIKILKSQGTPEEVYGKFDAFQRKHSKYGMEHVREWGKDTMCVIDELRIRYAQWIDFSRGIGATGHSYGGATAYYLCQHTAEIVCGINMDGAVFGDYQGMVMKKPFLQICCAENYNMETKPLVNTDAPVQCEIFHNMKHNGFTDIKFLMASKKMLGEMDALEMYEKLAGCHLEFFRKYL